jgi:hypothetical protein
MTHARNPVCLWFDRGAEEAARRGCWPELMAGADGRG